MTASEAIEKCIDNPLRFVARPVYIHGESNKVIAIDNDGYGHTVDCNFPISIHAAPFAPHWFKESQEWEVTSRDSMMPGITL